MALHNSPNRTFPHCFPFPRLPVRLPFYPYHQLNFLHLHLKTHGYLQLSLNRPFTHSFPSLYRSCSYLFILIIRLTFLPRASSLPASSPRSLPSHSSAPSRASSQPCPTSGPNTSASTRNSSSPSSASSPTWSACPASLRYLSCCHSASRLWVLSVALWIWRNLNMENLKLI